MVKDTCNYNLILDFKYCTETESCRRRLQTTDPRQLPNKISNKNVASLKDQQTI